MKYAWNEDTLMHFKFNSNYNDRENVVKDIREYVENNCTLEDGETEQDLVDDLVSAIYFNK